MHPIITEMPVQFEILVLLTLRFEAKTSLTEVVIDAEAIVFAPAILAPVVTRFHKLSDVDVPSRILRSKIARRFSDGMERNGE